MSQEAKFQDIKEEVASMVDDTLKKNLDEKEYEQKEAQSLLNGIVEEVINYLHDNQKKFKFAVTGTMFQKGDSNLHYCSTCLWNPNTDGSVTQKYENDTLHCFVSVFGIAS